MPLTGAEKQRRYRQRLKDKDIEGEREKQRKRWAARKLAGKIKYIADLTPEQQRLKRWKWKNNNARRRQGKRHKKALAILSESEVDENEVKFESQGMNEVEENEVNLQSQGVNEVKEKEVKLEFQEVNEVEENEVKLEAQGVNAFEVSQQNLRGCTELDHAAVHRRIETLERAVSQLQQETAMLRRLLDIKSEM